MKILIVTATYPPSTNGVAISTKRTVEALRMLGHDVWVIGPEHKNVTEPQYFTFQTAHHVPGIPSDYPLVLPWIPEKTRNKLERITWDIIHVQHPYYVSLMALKIGERCHAPVVFTYHSQYDHVIRSNAPFFPDWVYELAYYVGAASVIGKMAAIIATTKWLKTELEEKFPEIPIYYVSSAGLPKPFSSQESVETLRVQLALPTHEPIFIVVTRLSPEKNVSFLVKAFAGWASTQKTGTLIVIGDGNDRGDLEALVKTLHMAKRVIFVGNVRNETLSPWLNAADIFLYSSITDTVSVNLIEAMSAGLPIVALDDKTTREIIAPGINGYLSLPDRKVFVSYMNKALKNRSTLSVGAREQIQHYTMSQTTTSLVKTYEQIIERYRRVHR